MIRRACVIAVVLLLARAASAQDTVPYGETRLGISDTDRDGTLYVPKSYKAGTPMPLVMMLHGFSGGGDSQKRLFALAEELGFIAVAPESRDITWGKEAAGFDEDVRYLGAAFRQVGSLVNIDFDRVALAGQSDGAVYALTMGLAYGDTFNHVMIFAGGGLIEPIRRKGKPKIFIAHGVKDTTFPIDLAGRKNVAQLKREGYDVTYREHDGGHGTPAGIVREGMLWFLGRTNPAIAESTQPKILSVDHTVALKSIVPAISGQDAAIYVRERVAEDMKSPGADKVVLFVHGAGTPAEVSFDAPIGDYSWMAFLARNGFDVFSMDTEGYGRSSRPAPMNDPCNLSADQQKQFMPALIKEPCEPKHKGQLTTIASDWHDIDAVVDHIRQLRNVSKVSLVAWSLGGPRAGGYAAQHADKVGRLVLLAPAYNRTAPDAAPAETRGVAFNTQSRAEFDANWDRQIGCENQFEPAVRDAIWSDMLASDPVGARWGGGVRRAPSTATWGWNARTIGATTIPTLLVTGAHDKQVNPARVREAYEDLGASNKVLIDLGCSSHMAMWEKNHLLMFTASLEWLTSGTVNGASSGVLRLGY